MRPIPFRIVDIKVEKFSLTSIQFLPEEKVEVRTSYDFGVNVEKHMVQSRVSYNYLQNDNILLNLVLTCSFDVKPEEFNSLIHDDSFVRNCGISFQDFFCRRHFHINGSPLVSM